MAVERSDAEAAAKSSASEGTLTKILALDELKSKQQLPSELLT